MSAGELFGPEHADFRESFRAFLVSEALPHGDEWESAGVVDREFWRRAAAAGFVAFQAPEELGGAGVGDFRFNAVIDEELAFTGAVGDGFPLVNDIVTPYLVDLTDADQRRRWLPGVTSGETIPAIAMSEPGTGSDLRAIATVARPSGENWVLSGSKTFVTNGIQADLVIVAARVEEDDGGLGLFVVDAASEGFSRGRKLDKIGRRAQDTAELFFDEVEVGGADVIGEPGRGLSLLLRNLSQERLSIAVTAVANIERALRLTLDYVRDRRAFGQPVGSFQANRFSLAEAVTEARVARVYLDYCIGAHVRRELTADQAAGVKYWTSDLQGKIIDLCLQLHGGYGYMEEYPIARMWRDARVQRIYGGTNEIMKEIIGRSLGL
jgi:alkylation response protein AidB-like acyl-CoA dehydrogenase